ncbi:MAG: dockerin type I repeat-containing protein [Candidatus Zixiibacteriota bacterium]
MSHPTKVLTTAVLALLFTAQPALSTDRKPVIQKVHTDSLENMTQIRLKSYRDETPVREIRTVEHPSYHLTGWVNGNELYKGYIDPSASCENPYPFRVTEISMPMYFSSSSRMYVSVDIEDVYNPTPGCPWPGAVLAISVDYELYIPEPGYYDIWIPLDTPIVVNGPFFAGFFIGSTVNPDAGAALLTSDDPTALCRSYEIWDEQIGFIDLLNNSVFNFPGQLAIGAAGIPQQLLPQQPPPQITILSPNDSDKLLGSGYIWAYESSGSNIIDYVSFEYSTGNGFVEIGRDYDGSSKLRNDADATGDGDGYSQIWNFANLKEGNYLLRVTAVDTLGRTASEQISVYVEPSPPLAQIISFEDGSDICDQTTILMSCSNRDMSHVSLYIKEADLEYSAGMVPLQKQNFPTYYSGPMAAAQAIQLWNNRGYTSLMSDGGNDTSLDELVEQMAARFKTPENQGTIDELLFSGLCRFSHEHGDALRIEPVRYPDYAVIRKAVEEQEKAVLIAISGTSGSWLAVDGFSGWLQPGSTYLVSVCSPASGAVEVIPVRQLKTRSEIFFEDSWHAIDLMVSIGAADWQVQRIMIGQDNDASDGWSLPWSPSDLVPDTRYFIRAEGIDGSGSKCASTTIVNYDCSNTFGQGDYDHDGNSNLIDLVYLTDFVTNDGDAPAGGAWRGDANGDTYVNITDLVYYLNYLYGMAGPPRY